MVQAYFDILYAYSSILFRYEDAALCMSILLFLTTSSKEIYICATASDVNGKVGSRLQWMLK